jgi:hypothetical protein
MMKFPQHVTQSRTPLDLSLRLKEASLDDIISDKNHLPFSFEHR